MEGETNRDRDPNTHLEQDICIHIFSVASAMVGVCLTVIGLIRVVITLRSADTLADDLLAFLLGLAGAVGAPNASSGKSRRRNLYHCLGWNGGRLCVHHLQHLCSAPIS